MFVFRCEVDLFDSDIAQTVSMSRAAAERALAAAAGRDAPEGRGTGRGETGA